MIKTLLICCLLLIGLTACEKEVDMAQLPGSDLYGYQIRDIISSDNTGSNWFPDPDVNWLSKRKPVDDDRAYIPTWTDANSLDYLGKKKDCNIEIGNFGIRNIIVNGAEIPTWSYRIPTIKRTGDFIKYVSDLSGYGGFKRPIVLQVPTRVDDAHDYIMRIGIMPNATDVLGFKDIVGYRLYSDGWQKLTIGCAIRNESNDINGDVIFLTTDYLNNAFGNGTDQFSEVEFRFNQISTKFPTIFRAGTNIRVYLFVTTVKSLTAALTPVNSLPQNCWGLRYFETMNSYIKCEVYKYEPPKKYSWNIRVVKNRIGTSNRWSVEVYVKVYKAANTDTGGTTFYSLQFYQPRNIADPAMPFTYAGLNISLYTAGQPIGTSKEVKAWSGTIYTTEGVSEAWFNIAAIDKEDKDKTYAQSRVEMYY